MAKYLPYLAVALLCLVAVVSRVGMPWRMDVTNDEMIHLESYRNHYHGKEIFPEFNQRLSSLKIAPKPVVSLYLKAYNRSGLVQRLPLLLIDAHPPIHPVLAEISEATTNSSLLAIRLVSLVFGVGGIALMFFAGREFRDDTLGLWSAALLATSISAQVYSGIGRSYTLAQAALAAVLIAFFRQQKNPERSIAPFLAVALLAQASDWMIWAIIAPLIAVALYRNVTAGTQPAVLAKKCWWYVLLSLVLLAELFIQTKNPTIANALHSHSLAEEWKLFTLTGPFACFSHFRLPASAGALIFLLATFGGIVAIIRQNEKPRLERYAVVASALVSLVLIVWKGSDIRFQMVPMVVLLFLAAVGFRAAFRAIPQAQTAVCCVLGAALLQCLFSPEDPYRRVFSGEGRYSKIADRLSAELKPGASWISLPYFRGNCLFRYDSLPTPVQPHNDDEIRKAVKSCTVATPCIVFSNYPLAEEFKRADPSLEKPDRIWTFPNGFGLFRIVNPAAATPGVATASPTAQRP